MTYDIIDVELKTLCHRRIFHVCKRAPQVVTLTDVISLRLKALVTCRVTNREDKYTTQLLKIIFRTCNDISDDVNDIRGSGPAA